MQTSSWLCTGNSHLGHLGLTFFSWTMCISGRVSSFLSIALPNTSRFYSFSGLCWAQSVTSIGSQRRGSVAGDHLDVVLVLWEHFPFDYILWTLVQALIVYIYIWKTSGSPINMFLKTAYQLVRKTHVVQELKKPFRNIISIIAFPAFCVICSR